MAEPTSIEERRRWLLEGMGFARNKDLAATLRILSSSSRKAIDITAANGAHTPESLPPATDPVADAAAASSDQSTSQPVVARCLYDADLATKRAPLHTEPALPPGPRSPSKLRKRRNQRSE